MKSKGEEEKDEKHWGVGVKEIGAHGWYKKKKVAQLKIQTRVHSTENRDPNLNNQTLKGAY